MTHIVAILNQKGGVGKTTTTINLAAYLSKAGKRVLVVDFDPQGNATSGLGIDKQSLDLTCYDVLFHRDAMDKVVKEAADLPGLYLLPANGSLAAAEVELVGHSNRDRMLADALETATDYDMVLIDCPPALGLLTINALAAADLLLVPVQAEYYAMEGLSQLLSVMQRVKQSINHKLELLGVVITMYDGRTSLAEQVYDELKKYFGAKLFKTIIPRNVKLAEAPSYGKPVSEYDKWSKGARAYKQLAKEVIQRVPN